MNKKEISLALRTVGLALNACHNTVTTDDPGFSPDETSWRIDNSAAIKCLDSLEQIFFNNSCICPLCGCHNTSL